VEVKMNKTWLIAFLILAVLLSGCTAQKTQTQPTPTTTITTNAVDITGSAYSPATITVVKGTTVGWKNKDTIGHTVTADDNSFTSKTLNQDDTYSHTFDEVGTFGYHCSIHPRIIGRVIVTAS
jgi:plastocyanin